jgi:hypothetical protein
VDDLNGIVDGLCIEVVWRHKVLHYGRGAKKEGAGFSDIIATVKKPRGIRVQLYSIPTSKTMRILNFADNKDLNGRGTL